MQLIFYLEKNFKHLHPAKLAIFARRKGLSTNKLHFIQKYEQFFFHTEAITYMSVTVSFGIS